MEYLIIGFALVVAATSTILSFMQEDEQYSSKLRVIQQLVVDRFDDYDAATRFRMSCLALSVVAVEFRRSTKRRSLLSVSRFWASMFMIRLRLPFRVRKSDLGNLLRQVEALKR